jgi:protein-tyrosine phosphatase
MVRVLFVCLGNICRSPMAEAVFMHKVRAAGLADRICADSAGTGGWHEGERPHSGTRKILRTYNIEYDHRARLLTRDDLASFDYILAMDEQNFRDVQQLGSGTAHVARFLDYAPQTGVREVPDPYYSGGFEGVYRLLDAAADGLLAAIRRDHAL